MQGFNHIAGGLCFTGIFASFHDVNIFEKPEYLGLTVVCSLLPDIDHTRSIVGKIFYPLAKWLSIKFGHRTITHSLLFYIIVLLGVRGFELLYVGNDLNYTVLVAYSLLSHLVFDMCTRQGVPLFYPFSTRPCVLPANPAMRLRSNDLRSEAVVFVVFCSMLLFCMPLFANGFWMQYNKTFLNFNHIQREAKRKGDLLEITFLDVHKDTTKAILVQETETTFWAYQTGKFTQYAAKDCKYLAFRHTGIEYEFKQVQVFGVSVDSIKSILKRPLIKMQLQCNQDMNYYENSILKTGKIIEKEYIQGFDFSVEKPDNSKERLEIDLSAMKLQSQRANFEAEIRTLENEIFDTEQRIRRGDADYNAMSDYQKGRWQSDKRSLESTLESLKRERNRKTAPDTSIEETRLNALKSSLIDDRILMSGNFWILEL